MKLDIKSVTIKNFFSFGNSPATFRVEPGINFIIGTSPSDERSNGVGKTSLMESIPFALFGKTSKGTNKKQVINWKNKKGCEASIDFSIGSDSFKVIRGIKPDKLEIYKNKELINQLSDNRDYQKMLEDEILHIDYKTFMSVVHSNINSSTPILSMKKPEKRAFLEKLFNLEFFSDMNKKSNAKISSISNKISLNDTILSNNKSSLSDLEEKNKELRNRILSIEEDNSFEIIKDEYNKSSKDIESKKRELQLLKGKEDIVNKRIDDNNSIVQKIQSVIERNEYKIKTNKREIDSNTIDEKEEEELKKYQLFVEENSLENLDKKSDSINQSIESLSKESDQLYEEMKGESSLYTKKKAILDEERKRFKKIEKDGICPTCNQEISDEHKNRILNDIDKIKNEILPIEDKVNSLQEKIDKVKSEIKEKKKSLDELNNKKRTTQKCLDRINELRNIKNNQDKNSKLQKEIDRSKRAIKKLSLCKDEYLKEAKNKRKSLEEIEDKINTIDRAIEEFNSLTIKYEKSKEKEQGKKNLIKEIQDIIESNKEKIKSLLESNKEVEKSTKKFNDLLDYFVYIKDICKDDKIKQFAISSIIPYINRQVNSYLSNIGSGFYVVFDKWLDCEIKGPGITDGSYDNLSAGEKKSVDLSLMFTLMDLSRMRSGIFPSLIMLDEILDGSIDDRGIKNILSIIENKRKDDDLSIFIITHRQEINEVDNFDRKIIIEKDRGFSTIKEVINGG